MNATKRAEIRAKIKTGIYCYSTSMVFKVLSINRTAISGIVVYSRADNIITGSKVSPFNNDDETKFFEDKEKAIFYYKRDIVRQAKESIRRAKRNIISYQATIDKYPEFAI